MSNLIKKIIHHLRYVGIRFFLIENFLFIYGNISIKLEVIFHRGNLIIQPPYRIWGRVRVLIYGPGKVRIGKNLHAVSSERRSFFTLFSPCHITVIGEGEIYLGDHVALNGTTIVARKKISIGDNTMIGPNVIITDHNGHISWPPTQRVNCDLPLAVDIGRYVWIGMNSIILKGVKIGDGSIVAAGSVVISDVESGCLYAGNPAKKIKSLNV